MFSTLWNKKNTAKTKGHLKTMIYKNNRNTEGEDEAF